MGVGMETLSGRNSCEYQFRSENEFGHSLLLFFFFFLFFSVCTVFILTLDFHPQFCKKWGRENVEKVSITELTKQSLPYIGETLSPLLGMGAGPNVYKVPARALCLGNPSHDQST